MRDRSLAVARYEPMLWGVSGAAAVDLVFSGAERISVIPFVEIAGEMLLERERSPLIWPQACAQLEPGVLRAIEDLIVPWLQSLTFARQTNSEVIRRFDGVLDTGDFEAARAACFLGAAPYADVFSAAAPYVYAERFAYGGSVSIRDPRAGSGAALLAAHSTVRADLGAHERNALARRWFGIEAFGDAPDEADTGIWDRGSAPVTCEVALTLDEASNADRRVSVARPVPSDVLVSFDPEDSSPARAFGVRVSKPAALREWTGARREEAAGGSAGRILLLMREDWRTAADADTDEAQALAGRLEAEGFTVRIASGSQLRADERFDLVHAFTLDRAPDLVPALERLRSAGAPIVATANFARTSLESAWGPSMYRGLFAAKRDNGELGEFLSLARSRALVDGSQPPHEPQPFPGYDDIVRTALGYVDALVVCDAHEEQYARERFGYTGRCVAALPYVPETAAVSPDSLAGTDEYVLIHAPVDWRADVPLVVRAAVAQGFPVVVVGAAVDGFAYRAMYELGGNLVRHAPSLAPAEIAGLYRRARVYADFAWAPYGLARIARAASSGARLAVSRSSRATGLFTNVREGDPADEASIGAALRAAWDGAPPRPLAEGPDSFIAVISAYAAAQAARAAA